MSQYVDSFAHDLFPDMRSLKEFALYKRTLLAMLPEREAVGRTYAYPALAQTATAMGTDRASVQEVQGQANDVANFDGFEFVLGYFKPGYKAGFEIDDFDMAITEGAGGVPDGAYMEAFAGRLKGLIRRFGSRMERYFVGLPGKSLALTTANGGTTNFGTGVVQLADPLKITAFNRHQVLHASLNSAATPSSASLLGVGNDQKIYVIAIDYDAGQLIVSSSSGGAAGHAAMNTAASTNAVYLFNYSDFQGTSGYTPNVLPPGLKEWIPSTWSTSIGTFQGVDRGAYSALAGWRLPSSVVTSNQLDGIIEKALERAATLFGAGSDDSGIADEYVVAMSPARWTQLSQIAKSRGYRELNGETAYFGYRAIEIVHGTMVAKCISVPSMDNGDLFFLQFEDDGWLVRSLGGWPAVLKGDGMEMLRLNAADRFEVRLRSYFHWGCNGINRNGYADISSLAV